MKIGICTPRIFARSIFSRSLFGCKILAYLTLFASTFLFGHNPSSTENDPVAAAQWQPGAPQVQREGQIEIVHQDFPDGHGKFVYTLLQSDGTRLPLQFVKHPPTHLLTGDHITASGQQSSGGLILYSGANAQKTGGGSGGSTPPPSIPVPNTFGSQSVLVILINFQDDVVQPYTVTDVQNLIFGPVNNFILENSYGQASIAGSVVGWYTIPDSVTTCNINQIGTDAQNAASAAGVNLSGYTRFVYAFPQNNACGFAGASNVGGSPSHSWINGIGMSLHTVDHELGHALGLWHSHLYYCDTTATICSSPTISDYGDIVDTMGASAGWSPHYNAFQKERLGWLNYAASPSIQTVTSSGTYTIHPYELGGPGPNALKVLKSTDPTTGAKTWYYLESRQAIGFDSFLTDGTCEQCYTQNETTGVLFHLGTDGDGSSSDLLDMTPATQTFAWWFDPSLAVGQSFSDATADVSFTPTAVSSSGATVQIILGSCIPANPSVSVSPSQSQYVSSGTAVNFTVTVTDYDTSACAPANFNLAGVLPSGWSGVLSTAALTLSPSKSGSATLTVSSPAGTADGSYNIVASVTNASASSYGGSAAATYVINTAPLNLTLTTNQSSYLPGQTVGIYVTMLYGTLPDVGASATVTVTSPNGKSTTLSGITSTNGVALLSYKLARNASAGTYQVQYGTTVPGAASVMGATTSFTVQ